MTIDWIHFTPWAALAGGALIGLAAALLWWLTGRIAGISGLVGGLLTAPSDWAFRLAFTLGLIAAPLLWRLFAPLPEIQLSASFAWMLAAGLVVGVAFGLLAGFRGGWVDAVAEGQSGSLVAPGDYPALAQAALQVLADRSGAWQTRASTFAAQFAWPVMGEKLRNILQTGIS